MYLVIIGVTVGLVVGAFIQFDIPPEYSRYTAVAIVGALDSLFGAIRASVENKYNTTVFLIGLAFNIFLAVLITYFGDKLNLDLYLAILVAFMIRIFANINGLKTFTVEMIQKRSRKENNSDSLLS